MPQFIKFTNPLINADFPDPSVIYIPGDGYYAYATHDEFSGTINNIQLSKSTDLVNWTDPIGALATPPTWAKNCKKFWAPQVVKFADEYRLYFAAEPDTKDGMALAMAVSKEPHGFTDVGKPISQSPGSTYQMIDPCFFYDAKSGKNLLYYGSAHEPIRVVEVADDGFSFISQPKEVLQPNPDQKFERLREGTFVTYQPQFDRYLMWVSGDNTWAHDDYAVSVFWADDPQGTFKPIPDNHIILKPSAEWDSPGQNCILQKGDQTFIFYHAVDVHDRFITGTDKFKRKMCVKEVFYNEGGWPYLI